MILFDNVTHYIRPSLGPLIENASLILPTNRRIALLGLRGSGRTTLVQLVNGFATPRKGMILRRARVSFPVGQIVSQSPQSTVLQNIQDIARIYGVNFRQLRDFIIEMGEAEAFINRRVAKLSQNERQRIALPLAYGMPFDFYVIDGDGFGQGSTLKDKFDALARSRLAETGCLFAARKPKLAAQYCDMGAVLHRGELRLYENVNEAIAIYEQELEPLERDAEVEEEERLRRRNEDRMREAEDTPDLGVFI